MTLHYTYITYSYGDEVDGEDFEYEVNDSKIKSAIIDIVARDYFNSDKLFEPELSIVKKGIKDFIDDCDILWNDLADYYKNEIKEIYKSEAMEWYKNGR